VDRRYGHPKADAMQIHYPIVFASVAERTPFGPNHYETHLRPLFHPASPSCDIWCVIGDVEIKI
jgi:hypothetical protein